MFYRLFLPAFRKARADAIPSKAQSFLIPVQRRREIVPLDFEMDNIEDSAEESNAAGEQYEEEIVPKVINDEVFDEVTTRANTIVRDLQNSKQYLVAEDLQKLLLVCQNLRQNVIDEKDKIEQMKAEVIASQARVQHAVRMSKQDQEVIQQLKSEIGMKIDTQFFSTVN